MLKSENKMKKFHINKTLLWDYDFQGNYESEEFKRWYISRVLSCGVKEDISQVGGVETIKEYFPYLNLPNRIKQFWEWYFAYVHIH